jgi:hypothetical protein
MTDSNVTPFPPKDRTAAERKRRSRARQRKRRVTPVAVMPVTVTSLAGHGGGHGGTSQRIDDTPQLGRSVAVRNAAQGRCIGHGCRERRLPCQARHARTRGTPPFPTGGGVGAV